jgi:hypothetical protein
MAQNIGINAPTRIPTFSDDASIEEALRKYHFGIDNWSGDPVQSNLGMDGNFKAVKDRLTTIEAAVASIIGDGGGFIRSESKTSSPNIINPQTTSVVSLTVRGLSGQTANLQEWQNSSGVAISSINANGAIVSSAIFLSGAQSINSFRSRNINISTSAPSGGNDGDVWIVYE